MEQTLSQLLKCNTTPKAFIRIKVAAATQNRNMGEVIADLADSLPAVPNEKEFIQQANQDAA
jgi:hypothetical protein